MLTNYIEDGNKPFGVEKWLFCYSKEGQENVKVGAK